MSDDSILTSVKKVLGIDEGYTVYDLDILMHINSTFATLSQIGVGPVEGFYIEDESTEWSEYLDENLFLNFVKTFICLKVRLVFDPPQTSFGITAMEKQLEQLEWRINVAADPAPPVIREVVLVEEDL